MKTYIIPTITLCAFALLGASCKENTTSTQEPPAATETNSGLENIILKEQPQNAVGIAQLRKNAKAGDQVTFTGHILGSDPVFIENRAVMIMGDPSKLTACNLRPDDGCETPWDVCCDDPETIKSSIVTVQVVDESGSPLKVGLKGLSSIKELSDLTITGEINSSSNKDNMLINATGIYVNN